MIEIAKIDKIEKNRQYWKQNRQNWEKSIDKKASRLVKILIHIGVTNENWSVESLLTCMCSPRIYLGEG